jgi:hypothetical protein
MKQEGKKTRQPAENEPAVFLIMNVCQAQHRPLHRAAALMPRSVLFYFYLIAHMLVLT